MVTIACVWYNNWPNNDAALGVEYVNKLYRSVKRNTSLPFRFVCLTDNEHARFDEGIETSVQDFSPCNIGESGKIMLYNPNNGFRGKVLGLDLDTVIKDNIDDFLVRGEPFIIKKNHRPHKVPHLKGIGGDAVFFEAEQFYWLWKKQLKKPNAVSDERVFYVRAFGDEISSISFWQDLLPGRYISYKRDLKNSGGKKARQAFQKATLISFHGHPRPHQVQDAWLKPYWHEV